MNLRFYGREKNPTAKGASWVRVKSTETVKFWLPANTTVKVFYGYVFPGNETRSLYYHYTPRTNTGHNKLVSHGQIGPGYKNTHTKRVCTL